MVQYFAGGRIPFICAGYTGLSTYNDNCFNYDASLDQWVLSGNMSEEQSKRYIAYGSSESWGLVMAGGMDSGSNTLSRVDRTENGDIFESLNDLPDINRQSCLTIIDDDRIFTCGGSLRPSDTLIYSDQTGLWSR